MGVPYGRPGPTIRRRSSASRSTAAPICASARAAARFGAPAIGADPPIYPTHADFDPVAALGLVDCGNVRLTPGNIEDAFEHTEQAVDRIVQAGATPVTIGGDGSVTVPVARAVGKKHPKMAALHIDAHTDAYPYDLKREIQLCHRVHPRRRGRSGRSGVLLARRYPRHDLRAGRRAAAMEPGGYKVVTLDELVRGGFAQRMAEFRDKVGKRRVYLCFDMDVFDPSVAPGVCTPTWGGLSGARGHRPLALPAPISTSWRSTSIR